MLNNDDRATVSLFKESLLELVGRHVGEYFAEGEMKDTICFMGIPVKAVVRFDRSEVVLALSRSGGLAKAGKAVEWSQEADAKRRSDGGMDGQGESRSESAQARDAVSEAFELCGFAFFEVISQAKKQS